MEYTLNFYRCSCNLMILSILVYSSVTFSSRLTCFIQADTKAFFDRIDLQVFICYNFVNKKIILKNSSKSRLYLIFFSECTESQSRFACRQHDMENMAVHQFHYYANWISSIASFHMTLDFIALRLITITTAKEENFMRTYDCEATCYVRTVKVT